jgi:hypothetical protein
VIPPSLRGLVDDAAVFPPGNAPLAEAVRLHRDHRAAPHADLVGPLVVGDAHLPDLARLLAGAEDAGGEELALGVVVSGGAGALEPAVRWVPDGARLGTLAVALRDSATGETAHNARRICTAVDRLRAAGDLDDEVAVLVEPPRLYDAAPARDWLAALDEIAAADHRLKLRTGGADADAVPSAAELATCIGAALDRELSFSCTAGLHAAVRHRDAATGQVRHGFLNVLVATRASLDGAGTDDVAAVLQETDPAVLLAAADEPGRAGARRWFRSFGSCSIAEPLSDLETLGLVPS